MTAHNPTEVARETLKQLTTRKLLPTPENFEQVYNELINAPMTRENSLATRFLRALETLPMEHTQAKILFNRIKQVVEDSCWEQFPQLVIDFLRITLPENRLSQPWGTVIQNLIKAWELRLPDLTQIYKQTALDRLLINYGNQPDELNHKLVALIQNWTSPASQRTVSPAPVQYEYDIEATNEPESSSSSNDAGWTLWQRTLVFTLKHGLEPRLVQYPDLAEELTDLVGELEDISSESLLSHFMSKLRNLVIRLELQNQHEGRLVAGLTNLLKLLLENVAEINHSDSFLVGQVASIQDILAHEPLSMQHIYQLETNLKDVIRQQGALKTSLDEAASSLRVLLNRFINRLALMSDSTDDFQNKIQNHSTRLTQTRNVEEISSIIGSLLEDTSTMKLDLTRSRDELISAQEQVEAAENRIKELELALETASAKVKEDQLTGAYNRRGLAEHFEREISRAERTGSHLSIALLDVDNFKQLNDKFGHLAGDGALKYLVDIIKRQVRPSDIVARFGGEEFIILLPDTPVDDAVELTQRLQRELTKTFYLTNNERLLITFSAGVARWHLGERDTDLIERADHAMYQAKITGKNRVISAEKQMA